MPVKVHWLAPAWMTVSWGRGQVDLLSASTVPVMSFGVVVRLAPRNRLVNVGQVCLDAGKGQRATRNCALPRHRTLRG